MNMTNRSTLIRIIALIVVFVLSVLIGIYTGSNFNFHTATNIKSDNVGLHGVIVYFVHNGLLLLIPLISVFIFGIIAPVFLVSQAVVIGIFVGVSMYNGLSILDITVRMSHGLFEIPAMMLATWIGTFYVYKYNEPFSDFWKRVRKRVLVVYVLVGISAICEACFTPILIRWLNNG
uniref:Immunity protein n=2 Tax=Leuconostoc TaxID=1243 RepID=A0A068Q6J7_LEUME|nr:immunity protein [Leuconostoc mesenteroides]